MCALGYFIVNKLSIKNEKAVEKHTLIFFKFKNIKTGKSLDTACSIYNWPKKKAISDFMKNSLGGLDYELIILHTIEGDSEKEVTAKAKDTPYYSGLTLSEKEYLKWLVYILCIFYYH